MSALVMGLGHFTSISGTRLFRFVRAHRDAISRIHYLRHAARGRARMQVYCMRPGANGSLEVTMVAWAGRPDTQRWVDRAFVHNYPFDGSDDVAPAVARLFVPQGINQVG